MCLEVVAIPLTAEKVSAARLSDLSGLCVRKTNRPTPGALHFSLEPGCSCSLLADSADFAEVTWQLSPQVLEGLALAVETLAKESGGLRFSALWIGDQPATQERVKLKELLHDIRNNKVRNQHVYEVGTPPQLGKAK